MKERFDRIREICGGWGLYEPGSSTERAQLLKAISEVGELADSILKNDREQAKDDIGDIMVCLCNAHRIVHISYLFETDIFDISMSKSQLRAYTILLDEISFGLRGKSWIPSNCVMALKVIAESFELTLEECLDQAISVIEKRRGRIIAGVFIKDE